MEIVKEPPAAVRKGIKDWMMKGVQEMEGPDLDVQGKTDNSQL